MNLILVYTIYAVLSAVVTTWVGRTLHKNGRIFLVGAFHGNVQMADSVNHLLVVGFYLINFGFVSLFLSIGRAPESQQEALEYTKMGGGAFSSRWHALFQYV